MTIRDNSGWGLQKAALANNASTTSLAERATSEAESKLKKLVDDGNRLETLIIYASRHQLKTTAFRRKLLHVNAKLRELENEIAPDELPHLRDQIGRLIGERGR